MADKPTAKAILELYDACKEKWAKAKLQNLFDEDNRFYELDFLRELNIPKEFKKDATVLPTARDRLDALVDHTDISHARVFVNKKRESERSKESAEMLRKFALGLIHRTNVESSISPLRVSAKHYWLHGITYIETIWDADNWLDRPFQNEGESKDDFDKRVDDWRDKTHTALPITIRAVHPLNVIPDPYHDEPQYYFKVRKRLVHDIKYNSPFYGKKRWNNPKDMKEDTEVEQIEYIDKQYRCVFIDRDPVFQVGGGVINHKYGFLSLTKIESGLGNIDVDAAWAQRYVGILRYMKGLLISQSSIYSMCDILTKLETMIGGYVTGADADTIGKISQEYGKWWPMGERQIEFHKWERNLAPREAYAHLAYITDLIDIHSAPKSMFGLGEEGVRSGADRRLVLAEAQSKLNYSKDAFANGWAQVLSKCARLVKDVIPGDFEIWARTPSDEFDVVVKKNLFREPFNFYVEFAPISEEDEYRRHEDLLRMFQGGLYTKEHARSKLSDVDVKALEKQETREILKQSPQYLGMLDTMFAGMMQQAMIQAGLPIPQMPTSPSMPQGGGGMGAQGRGTTQVPNRAQPGSLQEMLNQRQNTMGTVPRGRQGQGGGGNTLYGT